LTDPSSKNDDDEDREQENDNELPEVVLDDEGYAKLPSRDGVALKGQQELVRTIFLASYSKFVCHLFPYI
jgi:hypothetical protein